MYVGERYGTSVNLNLSYRGRKSLRAVGMEEKILIHSLRVRAQMIRPKGQPPISLPLSSKGEMQGDTTDRTVLHTKLLSEAEACHNVSFNFQHKLLKIDLNSMILTFLDSSGPTPKEVMVKHDFIFGCDGAYSVVREQMEKHDCINFLREYAYHGYKEFVLPPTEDGKHALESDHVHLWEEHECVIIGVPNVDGTFRLTVVFPLESFAKFKADDVLPFFRKRFPEVVSLLGEEKLVQDFMENPAHSIITIKCTPHHTSAGALLLGDSVHAMVPFLGQATNCGFEDCLVFSEILKEKQLDLLEAAKEYSCIRCADTHAICDLSNDFYADQFRQGNEPLFSQLKEQIKSFLSILMPRTFMPLHVMVSFTRIPYATAVQQSMWQDRVVSRGLKLAGISTFVVGVLLVYQYLPLTRWMKLTLWHWISRV